MRISDWSSDVCSSDLLGAVVPGTDLSQHARLLSRVHDAVLSGQEPPAQPRTVVARSWSRVAAGGLTPDHCGASTVADFSELEARRSRTALRSVLPELRTTLTEVAEDAGFIVVVADAAGTRKRGGAGKEGGG